MAQRQRQQKIAEEIIQQRVAMVCARSLLLFKIINIGVQRLMTDALTHWTNRVVDYKFRELDTTKKREQIILA